MSRETIDKIIGEALVDPQFRTVLLDNPGKVADRFHLSPEELELLSNIRAGSLEELASQLYREIMNTGGDHISNRTDNPEAKTR